MHRVGPLLLLASITANVLALLLNARRFQADAIAAGQTGAGWLAAIVTVSGICALLWWRIARRAGIVPRADVSRWLRGGGRCWHTAPDVFA